MKNFILLVLCIATTHAFAQLLPEEGLGTEISLDLKVLKNDLNTVSGNSSFIQLPMPNGETESVEVTTSRLTIDQPADIFTYSGVSQTSKSAIKVAITPSGLTAAIHYENGFYFIEPIDAKANRYRIYNLNEAGEGSCGVNDDFVKSEIRRQGRIVSAAPFPTGTVLRKLRMAGAATGEMTNALGGQTEARDMIVAIINAANLIYEVEAAISFELISKTTTSLDLIFTNASTDPFTVNPNFASASNAQAGFNNMNTNNILLYNEYDIGHVFSTFTINGGGSSARGQAGPTPCSNGSKARAWSEFTPNSSVGFIVGLFVHEVGHQFRAWHTFNAVGGGSPTSTFCTGGWDGATAIEPGSGSTLMGYGNNCSSPVNYVLTSPNRERYFHTKSLEQISNTLNTVSTCFTSVATGNTPPISNAGADITIPKGTPFKLTGTGTDPNNNQVLSYAWEQYDVATANDKGAFGSNVTGNGGYTAVNSTASAPLFRSKISSAPVRTFPSLNFILNNANNPADNQGEDLPQVGRIMKFRLTTRDNASNGGGVDSDEVTVTVDGNSGPFQVSSQNTATLWISNGTNTTDITWDVNNTNAAPINVTNVKISLSTDGGITFPTVIVASTPNDGSYSYLIPSVTTSQARVKIEAIGNVFFDINNQNITISTNCTPETTIMSPVTALSAAPGNTSLNLNQISYGSALTSLTGSITASDQSSNLAFDNNGSCSGPSNSNKFDLFEFYVPTSGSYTFTYSGDNGLIMNLYSNSFNRNSVCTNWLASSGTISGGFVSLPDNFTKALTPGKYALTISSFSNNFPNLPVAYSITATGGSINKIAPSSNSPYAYTYIIYNVTLGNITAFQNSPNLTTYATGNYRIYGLSYQGGLNLTPYVNTQFSNFQTQLSNGAVCGKLSDNFRNVNITGPCPPSLTLSSPGGDIASGTVKQETSGRIKETNKITGGNVIYDAGQSVQLNPGFTVNNGVVFSAYIDGCGGQ